MVPSEKISDFQVDFFFFLTKLTFSIIKMRVEEIFILKTQIVSHI